MFRFDVPAALQDVSLADYKKHGIIKSVIEDYMFEDEQRNKFQACTENLIEKNVCIIPVFYPI